MSIKPKFFAAALAVATMTATSTPASAFFTGFNFGMDRNGPFFMMKDGPRFWHFNMDHPFGRYGDQRQMFGGANSFYRPPFSGYGGNVWQNPYNRFGSWNTNPWSRYGLGRSPFGYGGFPGTSPFGVSPYRYGMMPGVSPFGASPFGYGMNPMTGITPFGGSPFGGSPFGGFRPF